jgi:hypothetical protein
MMKKNKIPKKIFLSMIKIVERKNEIFKHISYRVNLGEGTIGNLFLCQHSHMRNHPCLECHVDIGDIGHWIQTSGQCIEHGMYVRNEEEIAGGH